MAVPFMSSTSHLNSPLFQILPAELSAAAVLINYWNKTVNNAAWITMCLVVVVAINRLVLYLSDESPLTPGLSA